MDSLAFAANARDLYRVETALRVLILERAVSATACLGCLLKNIGAGPRTIAYMSLIFALNEEPGASRLDAYVAGLLTVYRIYAILLPTRAD